jgi:pimeloyl-ACP methyl ester carboxylesterase
VSLPTFQNIYYYKYQGAEKHSTPVVFIHGAGGMYLSWPPEMRRLPGCTVYAPDLPGHGKSAQMGAQQSIQAYADIVYKWLDGLGLVRPFIIGHSMGGAIALSLALRFPGRVAGIGMINCGVRLPVPLTVLADAAQPSLVHRAIESMTRWSFDVQSAPHLAELVAQRMGEIRQSVISADLMACSTFDVSRELGKPLCPTLIICGAADRLVPPPLSQQLAAVIPNSVIKIIPNAGHMVMLEQPQVVSATLIEFIRQHTLFA